MSERTAPGESDTPYRYTAALAGSIETAWQDRWEVEGTFNADNPVGALAGTLDDRLNGTAAAGRLRAKTGTLADVTSLSGYVQTSKGRLLVFSILVGDLKEGTLAQGKAAVDSFAASLAAS